ncbi:OmpA family protein [Burkholderia cepacia]|uniref:OmpA family protein n=1 Tax=Burkholderia cepacia TaxID=292 RepID=UPI0009B93D2E
MAFACSFPLQYGGKIERGVTSLSNADRVELADLLITVRDGAAKDGPVVIYGFADGSEQDALTVARRRAESVEVYLQNLGISRSRINIDTKMWRNDSLILPSQRNQIEIEFIPACSPGGCNNPCGTIMLGRYIGIASFRQGASVLPSLRYSDFGRSNSIWFWEIA